MNLYLIISMSKNLLIIFAILSLSFIISKNDDNVTELDISNYLQTLPKHQCSIFDIYAWWCPHCADFKPNYYEAAKTLSTYGIPSFSIDGYVNNIDQNLYHFDYFPTVLQLSSGVNKGEINKRDTDSVISKMTSFCKSVYSSLNDDNYKSFVEQSQSSSKCTYVVFSTTSTYDKSSDYVFKFVSQVLINKYVVNLDNNPQLRKTFTGSIAVIFKQNGGVDEFIKFPNSQLITPQSFINNNC